MGTLLHGVGHGLAADDTIMLANLVGGEGLEENTLYYVLAAGLTADDFAVSLTPGGVAVEFSTDVTEGSVVRNDEYEPVDDGVMDGPNTATVLAPTDPVVDSEVVFDTDGKALVRLLITWTPVTEDRTKAVFVQVTYATDPDLPETPTPVWDERAVIYAVAPDQNFLAIEGVAGDTTYYVRTWAEDVFRNVSTPVSASEHVSTRDPDAPAVPAGVAVVADFKALFVKWNPTTAKDLAFFEVRYAPDDGTGIAPDTEQWTTVRTKTTAVYLGGLVADSNSDGVADKRYWVQVRAVDSSGNVATSDADSTAVDYLATPEAGWTTAASGDPSLTSGADISFGAITDDHIVTNGLSAGVIKTGDLRINTSDANMVDGIKVYDGADLVGLWNETGLYIYKATDPTDYVRLYDGGLTVYVDGVATTAINDSGINASALGFGSLPGGHNVILNSSFELSDFAAAPTTVTWTAAADWSSTNVSKTNLTEGAGALTMTAASY